MLVDSHTHLNTDQLYPNFQSYLNHFSEIGGGILINAGANDFYNQKGIEISERTKIKIPHLTVKTAIGWHPCDIPHEMSLFTDYIENLKQLYYKHKDDIVAIGECGIDLHFPENPDIPTQQYALRLQAKLARELSLPLMVHSREGFKETIEILKDFSDLKIYFHAWGYGKEELNIAESIFPNLWIGCTNVIEYPNAENIRESIKSIKTSKILTETDAPFLPPQCFRGKQNEPAYVSYVYEKLCEILGKEYSEISDLVLKNTKDLYSI